MQKQLVDIRETRCGRCKHLEHATIDKTALQCQKRGNYWKSDDKVQPDFGLFCPHFYPKNMEAKP